jgi:4-hydroxy-tetrahydrodipicolinate reductase
VDEHRGALVHGANFSVGVFILRELTAHAARLADRFPDYDPYVVEHHHRGKLDAPSGTAQRLAESLVAGIGRKRRIETASGDGAIAPDALHVVSVRAGAAFGHHEVGLDSPADLIRIVHTARGREGFARGALLAASWVRGKRGVFEFSEILREGGVA